MKVAGSARSSETELALAIQSMEAFWLNAEVRNDTHL